MNILVTGARGMLGSKAVALLSPRHSVTGVDLGDFDIADAAATRAAVLAARPDAVLHCAAYTAVDAAEDDPGLCLRVNETGTANVAAAAGEAGAVLVYYSTDYVFDGLKGSPYLETDPPNPIGVYGRSKYLGELAVQRLAPRHFILRIAWLYGENGKNIVRTMLRLARERGEIRFVDDQYGSPTYAGDVIGQTERLLGRSEHGVYHCTAEGAASWFEVARAAVEYAGIPAKVLPLSTRDFPTRARRPPYSYLENAALGRLGIDQMPGWRESLARYITNGAG